VYDRRVQGSGGKTRVTVLSIVALGLGCGADAENRANPTVVRDTTGIVFDWRCDDDGCDAVPREPPADAACGTFYGNVHGRFVRVCSARRTGSAWSTTPEKCRLVACTEDPDCPQWGDDRFICRSGLCQNDGAPLSLDDAIGLCLDGARRSADCLAQSRDPLVAAAIEKARSSCPADLTKSCAPPAGCRQP
jgi:hypothetical protein